MTDPRAEIVVDGDITPLRQKLREGAADLKRFGEEGEGAFSRMAGPLGTLQSKFLAIGAVLGGGKVFAAAVEESRKLTGEANGLAKALSISTTEGAALNTALGDIYSSADEFLGASQHLSRQLRSNESDLNAMGLRTREANGEYRNMKDLMFDAITVLNGYKEGTDRTLAAQAMFGKGAAEVNHLLRLQASALDDAKEKNEQLGLTIGVQNVQAVKEYKAAMNDAGDAMSAVKKVAGDAVMPVLTQLATWFAETGPTAVVIFRGIVGGIISLFWGLKFAAESVWNAVAYVIEVTTIKALRFADAAMHAMRFDFEGAREAWNRGTQMLEETAQKRLKNIMDSAEQTREKLWNLFAPPDASPAKHATGRNYKEPAKPGGADGKDKGDGSVMAYYEAALAEEKRLASERDALREYTKQEELTFWQTLLQYANLSAKDRVAIDKKASELIVAIRREEAKRKLELETEDQRSQEALALARIETAQAAMQAAADLDQITKVQMSELEKQFEAQRYEIQRQGLLDRLALLQKDPNTNPVEFAKIKDQILELEQQHRTKLVVLDGKFRLAQKQAAAEGEKIWDNLAGRMASLWDKGVQAMMNGTFRWRNAFRAIGTELVGWFANEVVGAQVKTWLAGQMKMLAIKLGFLQQEKAVEVGSAVASAAAKKVEGMATVQANAAEAATGAAASQASIPIVGPELALAAMAETFAAVSGFGIGALASAAGGFDIPKGLNPLTQLHEEEMVLPAKYADVIRGLAAGEGGAASAGSNAHFHFHGPTDRRGLERWFKQNATALAPGLRDLVRNFTPKS